MSEQRRITPAEQKKVLLDMLRDLDFFCEHHNIRYFLAAGSLLGAIRHKGFIPWDDDIDVVMPRLDYDRFVAEYQPATRPYQVISTANNPDYYLQFAKLIDTSTVMREPVDRDLEIGIYIDIFPLDNLSDNYEMAKKMFDRNDINRKKLIIKNLVWLDQRPLYQNILIRLAKALVMESRTTILNRIDKLSRTLQSKEFSKYIGVICSGTYGHKEIMESEWYSDFEKKPFEDCEFRVPIGYDRILSQMYGNYMELPPKEKQVSRHTYEAWYKE